MLTYHFNSGIYHCASSGYSIILDLKHDRYSALSAEAHRAISRLEKGDREQADEAVLERLVSQSILRTGPSPGPKREGPMWERPTSDYRSLKSRRTIGAAPYAMVAQFRAMIAVRCFSLEKCLERVAAQRAIGARNGAYGRDATAFRIAAAFQASSILLSSQDRCLTRSIAMMNQLSRNGCWGNLILGVSARPFRAHAWVQYRDVVLSDILDNIRLYSPIYIL